MISNVKVLEPRVNIKSDQEKSHIVLHGGQRVNEQVVPADSFNSQQVLFTVNPPSTRTIVDRYIKVRYKMRITTDQNLNLGTDDALRAYPINSIIEVSTVQINGESISDNTSDKLHALECYGNCKLDRTRSASVAPIMPDAYQTYAQYINFGSAKCPLKGYGENNGDDPRGGYPVDIVSQQVIEVVVTEPLKLSPFLNGYGSQDEGFINVNQMNIQLRHKSDLSRVLSHSTTGNAITNVQVEILAADLLINYITPDITQSLPDLQVLSYHKSLDYVKSQNVFAPDEVRTVRSDSIKLSQIPRRLYLFCSHSRATESFLTSDSFMCIERLNILWGTQNGLFSSASKQDLYEMSVRNGYNLGYQAFSFYRGSVLCIEFAKDIGLMPDESVGVQGQYTIQIEMDVKNTSPESFTPDFYQIFLMEGTFSIFENGARSSLGNLTKEAVLESKEEMTPEVSYNTYENLNGGSFFSGLKNVVNKVAHGVEDVANIAGMIPGLGEIAGPVEAIASGLGSLTDRKIDPRKARRITQRTIEEVNKSIQRQQKNKMSGGQLSGGRLMRRRKK